jgi:Protein of unknown function (DUF3363)
MLRNLRKQQDASHMSPNSIALEAPLVASPNQTMRAIQVSRKKLYQMARERGLTYMPANAGDYVNGRLAGVASLVSGRFAMIDNGLGFQLVPWQPLLERRIGQHISGLQRDDGGIEWTFGRNRGLSL